MNVRPLFLPIDSPMTYTCAVDLALLTDAKAVIVSSYLPQPMDEHARVCHALAKLPFALPHHLLILGGDLQGGWTGSTPKATHIHRALPFARRPGEEIPTLTSR